MYINMNEILDKFSQFTLSYKISFDADIVNFKFSTKNLQNYSPYCLYIFRSNKLPKEIFNYNKINFLIIGEPQDLPYLNRCNYIILKEDSISIFDIIKIIQSLLNFDDALSSFKEKLFFSIKDDLSISNMISIAFEYLNNPIMESKTDGFNIARKTIKANELININLYFFKTIFLFNKK